VTERGRNSYQSGSDWTKRVRGVGILRRYRSMLQGMGNILSGPARTWLPSERFQIGENSGSGLDFIR